MLWAITLIRSPGSSRESATNLSARTDTGARGGRPGWWKSAPGPASRSEMLRK